MVIAVELWCPKGDVVSSFVPLLALIVLLFHGEDGDKHTLLVKWTFFDYVDNVESAHSLLCISNSKEKPVIVAIRVEIVLYHQMVLLRLNIRHCPIYTTDIPIFKAGVDAIFFSTVSENMNLQLELFEWFPVVVQKQI